MHPHAKIFEQKHMKILAAAAAVFGLAIGSGWAQQIQLNVGDVDVSDFSVEAQQTPQYQASGPKSKNIPNPRDWLEVEVEFEVKGRRDAVVPELMFRYYIGFKDQSGNPRVLTGDVKHKNIVVGESTYSAVYVHPSTLGEITGDFRKFQQSAVEAIGLEVIYNGVVVGGKSTLSGSSAKFWQATGTSPGVLAKHDTPFALLWIDRYAEAEKN